MKYKVTSRKSSEQGHYYTQWDNTVTLTRLPQGVDLDDIDFIASDCGGQRINTAPLKYIFYECGQRWYSVEVDTFIGHLESLY